MKFIRTNKYDAGLRAQLGIYAPTVGGRGAAWQSGACAGIPGALLLRGTLGAVLGIEAGVLAWAYTNKDKSKTPALPIAAGGYDPRYGRFHVASPWGSR